MRLQEDYKKASPPLEKKQYFGDVEDQVMVNLTITLEDLYTIKDTENEIELTFSAMLTLFEVRTEYYDLKADPRMNVLQKEEKARLWVPEIVFQNRKEVYNTIANLAEAEIFIKRRGNSIKGGVLKNVDTKEFIGNKNPLAMNLTTMLNLRCTNYMNVFPFDKQVKYQA